MGLNAPGEGKANFRRLSKQDMRHALPIAIVVVVLTCWSVNFVKAAKVPRKCSPPNKEAMSKLMGPAFNSRYMSVDPPPNPVEDAANDVQADQAPGREFFVGNPNYEMSLSNFNLHLGRYLMRRDTQRLRIRRGDDPPAQWKCKSTLEWEDLGDDHFPRYLRKVKCLCERCWYNHFQCKPRSFTVNVLRRRDNVKCSFSDKPLALEDQWEVVERAVPFCCDCVAD